MALIFFFFNDTATTEIYTLSLHDALPISIPNASVVAIASGGSTRAMNARKRVGLARSISLMGGSLVSLRGGRNAAADRKSTRLNSSHLVISYAVFCLTKKKSFATSAYI